SRTIDRARELGIVMDRELIEKAQELDRRWQELNTTIGTWFKRFAVGAADAVQRLVGMRAELDEILADEGRARAIFGNEVYERIADGKRLSEEQKEILTDISEAMLDAIPFVEAMAESLRGVAEVAAKKNPELSAEIMRAAENMSALAFQLENGFIEADEFHRMLIKVIGDARTATESVGQIDGIGFGAVLAGLGRLAAMLGFVAQKGQEARAAIPAFLPQNTGTPLSSSDVGLLPPDPDTFVATSPRPRPAPAMTHELVDPGGRSSGKGGGRTRDEYAAMIEATQRQIALLEAEAAALLVAAEAGGEHAGMMDYARKRAELLMAAQRQGLVITPELTAEIEAQARAYATAGLEAEAAADRIRQIEEASERGRDALTDMFGSILDGSKSAKQAVADLLMEIAKAQMSKGLSSLLGLGGGGGFTGFVGGLLSFDGGGYTGSAPRTGGLDGKGGFLAMMHPRESVIDHTRGASATGGSMAITVNVEGASGDQHIIGLVQQGVSAGLQSFDRALPDRLGQINRNPRYR
ncbi:hypothetical protein ABNX41_21595, partial [Rhodobacteraceae bacterium PA1-206B]